MYSGNGDRNGNRNLLQLMWEVFSCKKKIRKKLLTAVLNPKPLHILCVREGEDDQGGTGKESFCRQYQEASSGSTAGL